MPPTRKKIDKTLVKKRIHKVIKRKGTRKDKNGLYNKQSSLSCKYCEKQFGNDRDLVNHSAECKLQMLTLSLGERSAKKCIKCNDCNKMFKFKKNYVEHCQNEHSKLSGSVVCPLCPVRCPNKTILKDHMNKTHNRDEFECTHCKKRFVRRAHVLRHMSQSGCDGSEVQIYPCEICNATFTRKDNLIVHLRYQHILKSGYKCKHCIYGTKNFSKLIKHWQDVHLKNQKYECDICGKSTSSRNSIAKHLEIHGEKKHSCAVCGYKTFTAEVLKRHLLTHVQDKPHKCEVCGQSYIQRLQLQRHMEKHTGNICTVCKEAFPTKARLLVHQRVHLGLDKLVCPFQDCPFYKKAFASESNLHSHVKTHLVTKDFKCEVCNKMFHCAVNMQRHMNTHRLDRPRRCMYCLSARAYVRGEQLLRHVRREHPELFRSHLAHVRNVMGGTNVNVDRVRKSELESILNVLDAESDRIIEGYGGSDVLYGGVQVHEVSAGAAETKNAELTVKNEQNPLMSEEDLEENLKELLLKLIDLETLECFGWPDETVDIVLERVIEQCGVRGAERDRWTRVQCLRENAKLLFLHCVDDKHVAQMLDTHTIDQIVKHILAQEI